MSEIGEIATYLIYVRDSVKFYHWSTKCFARHKASDEFVNRLTENTDNFIEILQGYKNKRLILPKVKYQYKNESDESIVIFLKEYRVWLIEVLPKYLDKKNTDLNNIRDSMLGDVNQILYLFTFK